MNYPLWDLPAPGLLIALVAILHVFVSHFAVGGGLFLVVTEIKARREGDGELLAWLRRHSRFFILLTLVFGAVSGVGIWFTIGLVHPAATSSLINAFVWGWAIEWTFFLTEIAAAMVYYYGWDTLTPRRHVAIGWIYFVCAYASLVVINGILAFMLTPGMWLKTHAFWDGFFNPTYWPSLAIRTFGAIGLAGVYALLTASWLASPELRQKITRYAALAWVLPMAIGLPLALWWYFVAANGAGVDVMSAYQWHPVAQRAIRTAAAAIALTTVLTFVLVFFRRQRFGRIASAVVMLTALVSIGGSEWAREDLRKPFVIGSYMYVNGMRATDVHASMLASARFVHTTEGEVAQGRELFRLTCSQCHTVGGYLGIRKLVAGRNSNALEGVIARLDTWRHRRMPPFAGNDDEKRALAVYLATLGGGRIDPRTPLVDGAAVFDASCAMCHSKDGDFPIAPRVKGLDEAQLYDVIGKLPERNPMMPAFEGSEAERRALAKYLAEAGRS